MIEVETRARLHEFAPQGLTNLAWAYATAGYSARALFDDIANEVVVNVSKFNNTQVAILLLQLGPRRCPPHPYCIKSHRPNPSFLGG